MTLKINAAYKMITGEWLIPRSHISSAGTGERFAVVEILTGGEISYIKRHTTMNCKELRKALDLAKNEKVEVV